MRVFRTLMGIALAVLSFQNYVYAQCNISVSNAPVHYDIALNSFTTSVTIDGAYINGQIFSNDPGCDKYHIIDPVTDIPYPASMPYMADCSTVGMNNIALKVVIDTDGNYSTTNDNSSPVTFTISVMDSSIPIITCPSNVVLTAPVGTCEASHTPNIAPNKPTVMDNCPDSLLYAISSLGLSGNAVGLVPIDFPIDTTIIQYTAKDKGGNSSSCTYMVVVKDNEDPEITCPPSNQVFYTTTNSCDISNISGLAISAASMPSPGASMYYDNCGIQSTSYRINSGSAIIGNDAGVETFGIGLNSITYIVKDNSDNTATCSFNIEVKDNSSPTLTCPATDTVYTSNYGAYDCNGRYDWNDPVPNDNCTTISSFSFSIDNGPSFPITTTNYPRSLVGMAGTTANVTYKVVDSNSNPSTCSFTITYIDDERPEVSFPISLIELDNGIASCFKQIDWNRPHLSQITDNCLVSDVTVTEKVTSGPDTNLLTGLPPFMVDGSLVSTHFPVGVTVITYTFTDKAGNFIEKPLRVVINDIQPPHANCEDITVELTTAPSISITGAMVDNNSTDNCDTLNYVSVVPSTFDCSHLGVNPVVLTVEDQAGNSSSCTSQVTVTEYSGSSIVCPDDIIVGADANTCTATINDNLAVITQNICSDAIEYSTTGKTITPTTMGNILGAPHLPFTFNQGLTTVRYVVRDGSNNAQSCSFNVTVTDSVAPVFIYPPADITLTENTVTGSCIANVTWDPITVSDNCTAPNDVFIDNNGHISGNPYDIGTTQFGITAEDESGNIALRNFTIIVVDNEAPIARCKPATVILDDQGQATISITSVDLASDDNCGISSRSIMPTAVTCADVGVVPVTLTLEDLAGNMSTCIANVTVLDTISTIASCTYKLEVDLDSLGQATVHAMTLDSMSSANCGITDMNVSINGSPFADSVNIDCSNIGNNTAILRVLDHQNRSDICTTIIEVNDVTIPAFTAFPQDFTINCDDVIPAPPNPQAIDECTGQVNIQFSNSVNPNPGPCGSYNYDIIREWIATDDSGNSTAIYQTVTVQDTTPPTIMGIPSDTTLYTGANATPCSVRFMYNFQSSAQDNCSSASELFFVANNNTSPIIDELLPQGVTTYFIYVLDACGNIAIDTMNVEVIDNTTPTLVCYPAVTISLGTNGQATLLPSNVLISGTDNCGTITNASLDVSSFDCTDLGTQDVVLTITDASGNSNSCQVSVEVQDPLGIGFTLAGNSNSPSYFGATDGSAHATTSGGSGNFSYLWAYNNSTNSTLSNVPAGDYEVTVVDNITNCMSQITITIDDGTQMTFDAGNGAGATGDIVSVPVTVDLFNNITDFDFDLILTTPGVGYIRGISGPALTAINESHTNYTINVNWSGSAATLSATTVLCYVDIELIGAAGSTSLIEFDARPAVFQALVSGNTSVPTLTDNGMVTVTSGTGVASIKGRFLAVPITIDSTGVEGVDVNLTGTVTNAMTTTTSGAYSFNSSAGDDVIVTPNKTGAFKNSTINVGDIVKLQRHISRNDTIMDPYKLIAADVFADGQINVLDVSEIQLLLVGSITAFQQNTNWKFVPLNYVFPDPTNPWTPAYPEQVSYTPILGNITHEHFAGIKIGNVTGPATTSLLTNRSQSPLRLTAIDQVLEAGKTYTLDINGMLQAPCVGWQAAFSFDPTSIKAMDVISIVKNGLSKVDYQKGSINVLWTGNDLDPNEPLLQLSFTPNEDGLLSDLFSLAANKTFAPMAIDHSLNEYDLPFEWEQPNNIPQLGNWEGILVSPNPFTAMFNVSFGLDKATNVAWRILDATGKTVLNGQEYFLSGNHNLTIDGNDLPQSGQYYLEMTTKTQQSIIVINKSQ